MACPGECAKHPRKDSVYSVWRPGPCPAHPPLQFLCHLDRGDLKLSMPNAVGQSPSLDPHKSICHGQQPPPDHSSPSASPLSITYSPRGQAAPPRPLALHPLHTPSPTHQLVALRSGPWKLGAPPCVEVRLPLSPPHTGESSPEHTQRQGLSLLVPQTQSPPVLPPPTREPEPPNCHERPPPPTPRPALPGAPLTPTAPAPGSPPHRPPPQPSSRHTPQPLALPSRLGPGGGARPSRPSRPPHPRSQSSSPLAPKAGPTRPAGSPPFRHPPRLAISPTLCTPTPERPPPATPEASSPPL
ncbi:uncharacterized protein LOC132514021 [Lagenorhynchus albirostris]|uniref:uncharacterized protein LOC132514021 n=1 Tax=Lagenorhynchus albirostris TaxID=27610 RepID=UPI0028E7D4AB|nr:uncharacterized protein LOC132514021 [Lagenorhynchus albirostris]